jgi:23S rRNA (adenine-N6)-dimethyltransferase
MSNPLWISQNFIKRPQLITDLLTQTSINRHDLVVEIGAGKGMITTQLAKVAKSVLTIELDGNLIKKLTPKLANFANVKLIQADFLHWQLPTTPYKVFANIPFNLTADIFRKLTDNPPLSPTCAYLFMQDKAAYRFIGIPHETQISILIKPIFAIRILAFIDKKEFTPSPKVKIVLVEIVKREKPIFNQPDFLLFQDFIAYCFKGFKPTVAKTLKRLLPLSTWQKINSQLKLASATPSQLSWEKWQLLFAAFQEFAPLKKKLLVHGSKNKLINEQKKLQRWYRTR